MAFNKLKRVSALLMCTLLAFYGAVVCSAAGRYTVSELDDMVISLPDGMDAATRSSKSTDRYFSVFGLDYDTTISTFKSSDIYMQGMDNASQTTVTVTMTKTDESKNIVNYSLLSADKLAEVQQNFINQNEYHACTPDQTGSIVWLDFDVNVTNNGKSIKAYQSNTVYDGMSINVTLQRNEGDVTAEDYAVFSQIVSSVSFLKGSASGTILPFVIVGGIIIAVVVLVLIIIFAKRSKKRGKKNQNAQILEELASKYTVKRDRKNNNNRRRTEDEDLAEHIAIDYEDEESSVDYDTDISEYSDGDYYEEEPQKNTTDDGTKEYNLDDYDVKPKYSDEEIDRLLGEEVESQEVKIYTREAPKAVVPHSETDEKIIEDTSEIEDISSTTQTFDGDSEHHIRLHNSDEDEQNSETAEIIEDAEDVDDIDNEDDVVEEDDIEEFDTDEEEFDNDEELLRQEAKKTKFSDSDDFFEEAPLKTVGVLNSKDIKDAEDYDVINEVEERVSMVEGEDIDAGAPFTETLAKIGNGFKSFGMHCGYFCKNVSRMIKRKSAAKKRRKAEEERRQREKMRAARARQQQREIRENGIVKVHSRNDNRQGTARPRSSSAQRRPQQGRPQQSRPNQNRPNPNNRRPSSRPPQKRR